MMCGTELYASITFTFSVALMLISCLSQGRCEDCIECHIKNHIIKGLTNHTIIRFADLLRYSMGHRLTGCNIGLFQEQESRVWW
jgi:hypothetical protein